MKLATKPLAPVVAAGLIVWATIFTPAGAYAADDAVPAPTPAGELNTIVEFQVTPARLRGRVELSWQHPGLAEGEIFLVERSTNGSSWRSVSACKTPRTTSDTGYACTDKRLTSGTTYTYRACVVIKGASCSSDNVTEGHAVKAP